MRSKKTKNIHTKKLIAAVNDGHIKIILTIITFHAITQFILKQQTPQIHPALFNLFPKAISFTFAS